jgi:hypothetical protein
VRGNRLAASRILRVSYKTMLNKIAEYGLAGDNGRPRPSFVVNAATAGGSARPAMPPRSDPGPSPDAK